MDTTIPANLDKEKPFNKPNPSIQETLNRIRGNPANTNLDPIVLKTERTHTVITNPSTTATTMGTATPMPLPAWPAVTTPFVPTAPTGT